MIISAIVANSGYCEVKAKGWNLESNDLKPENDFFLFP